MIGIDLDLWEKFNLLRGEIEKYCGYELAIINFTRQRRTDTNHNLEVLIDGLLKRTQGLGVIRIP